MSPLVNGNWGGSWGENPGAVEWSELLKTHNRRSPGGLWVITFRLIYLASHTNFRYQGEDSVNDQRQYIFSVFLAGQLTISYARRAGGKYHMSYIEIVNFRF